MKSALLSVQALMRLPGSVMLKCLWGAVCFKILGKEKFTDELVVFEVVKWVLRNKGSVKCDDRGVIVKVVTSESLENLFLTLRWHSSDFHVFRQVFMDQEYLSALRSLSKKKSPIRIIDAGANIGLTTLWFKQRFPLAEVLAIEADTFNFDHLQKNLALNPHIPGITAIRRALWVNNDELFIKSDFRDGREHSRSVTNSGSGCSVAGITPAQAKDFFSGREISLFKIDIEGAEVHFVSNSVSMKEMFEGVELVAIEIHEEFVGSDDAIRNFGLIGFTGFSAGETWFLSRDGI